MNGTGEKFMSRGHLRLSPDGKHLAFDLEGDIYVQDLERGTRNRLTSDEESAEQWPVWHPDGNHIIFSSNRDQDLREFAGPSDLYKMRADGTSENWKRLATGPRMLKLPTSISQNGRYLAFNEMGGGAGGVYNIWTLALEEEGAQPEPFLQNEPGEFNASFSPDGRWLAYSSFEAGPVEVYVRPFPKAPGKWPISTGGCPFAHPFWSRTDDELFYSCSTVEERNPRSTTMHVVSFRVEDSAFLAGNQEVLFSGIYAGIGVNRGFDLAPDGKRFVMVVQKEEEKEPDSPKLIWVQNWFEALKRLVPTDN